MCINNIPSIIISNLQHARKIPLIWSRKKTFYLSIVLTNNRYMDNAWMTSLDGGIDYLKLKENKIHTQYTYIYIMYGRPRE